jgi:hypothetical protein
MTKTIKRSALPLLPLDLWSLLGTRQKEQDVEPKATDFMSGVFIVFLVLLQFSEKQKQ